MRKLIENPTFMTFEEMEEKFIGKWILITNCEYGEFRKFIGGIPVAVADTPFEGQQDGFYDKFRDPKYAPRADEDFDYQPGIFGGFTGELKFTDEVPVPMAVKV